MKIAFVTVLGVACLCGGTRWAGAREAQKGSPVVVQTELGKKLDDYLTRLSGFGFSGVALVTKDGKIVIEKGYGYAHRERRIPNTPATVLPVGSITKQFTAAAILKLEMQGKLKTSDAMSKYIPHVPPDKAGITLHHLLTHSAGFEEGYGDDYEKLGREEFIERVMKAKLQSPPGERYRYSNAGYSLLAAIVELVSGQSWERFLHDQLFIPAGMLHTGCVIPNWRNEVVAHGYQDGEDWGTFLDRFGPDGPYWNQRGNGGILSTVGDMYRWHVALEGEKVLSAEAKKKYYTPYIREGPEAPTFYGYGWVIGKTPRGTNYIAHNGGNRVFAADFIRLIDDHVVIYAASNSSKIMAWQASPRIERIIFGVEVVFPPKVTRIPQPELAKYAGTYTIPSSESRLVAHTDDDHLVVSGDGQAAAGLLDPPSADRKEYDDLNVRTARILTEARNGNYDPLIEAFGGGEEIKERQETLRKGRDEKYGAFKGLHVLGTMHGPEGSAVTVVREEHENGVVFLNYVWDEERTVEGFRISETPPGISFFPESADSLVAFDLPSASLVRISAQRAGDGTINGLKFSGHSGEVVAARVK